MNIEISTNKDKCFINIRESDNKLISLLSDFQDMQGMNTGSTPDSKFLAKNFLAIYALGVSRGLNQAQLSLKNLYDKDTFNNDMDKLSGVLGIPSVANIVEKEQGNE
tara:strand:+ start:618 stop:938 length:321 start_codon:yes stop_codon:yes gene_type:complete